jgi:hypothetical protein
MRGCEDWERLRDGDPAAARLRMAILTDNEYRRHRCNSAGIDTDACAAPATSQVGTSS